MSQRTFTKEELEKEEEELWRKNHKKIIQRGWDISTLENQREEKRKEKKLKEIEDKRYQ